MNEKWVIEVKTEDGWKALRPTNGEPYVFYTQLEAIFMKDICYPDSTSDTVRVVEKK